MEKIQRCAPGLTMVLPIWNECEVINRVVEEILSMPELSAVALLLVDDGSQDGSGALLDQLVRDRPSCQVLHLPHGGKDQALWSAFQKVDTEWVGIMDADGQYDPHDAVLLLQHTRSHDAIWGFRAHRHDQAWRHVISQIGRWVKGLILSGCTVSDTGCGLWIARARYVHNLAGLCPNPAGQVHCHIPEIIKAQGGKIAEYPIQHRARLGGHAKYGAWNRLLPGLRSLLQSRQLIKTLRISTPQR